VYDARGRLREFLGWKKTLKITCAQKTPPRE
jgi:hypothetical protein